MTASKASGFVPLRWKIAATIVAGIVVLAAIVLANGVRVRNEQYSQNLRDTISQTSQLLNITVTPLSLSGKFADLGEFLSEMLPQEKLPAYGVSYFVIFDLQGGRLLNAGLVPKELPQPTAVVDIGTAGAQVHVRQRILLPKNQVGHLQFGFAFGGLKESSNRIQNQALLLTACGILLIGMILMVMGDRLAQRIKLLKRSAQAVQDGNLQHRAPETGSDEISQLGRHFNTMATSIAHRISELEATKIELAVVNASLEKKVLERTRELAQSNANLADANMRMETALDVLRSTQAELVQREKLASLGRMVAGIAHELNTPIGTAVTAGTTLHHLVRQLKNEVDAGQLKKSSLDKFLAVTAEGSELLESALHKAHILITHFREVATDHTDEAKTVFSVTALLQSMQSGLQPGYENSPIALVFDLEDGIEIESYPGHLTQVLIQLIDNARGHAFNGLESGVIRVELKKQGDRVCVAVCDNGQGISADIRDKVFDPFFTTRMGGNIGLGLNLVYTLVTHKLGGSVSLYSVQPQGARFEVWLP